MKRANFSILKGLFGYERSGLRRGVRLVYIPIHWGPKPPEATP